jgi:cytochrome P450
MTDRQVRDEAMTIFLADHETTANALTWTWYLLSQSPDVEARLHAEVAQVLKGRLPAVADIQSLPLVDRVVTESMRLYPPADHRAPRSNRTLSAGTWRRRARSC